jgi:hypothetical protein
MRQHWASARRNFTIIILNIGKKSIFESLNPIRNISGGMMKFHVLVILLFIIFFIQGSLFPDDEGVQTNQGLKVSVLYGGMGFDGMDYNTFRLMPGFKYSYMDLRLNLEFDFDTNGNFRTTEWDSWQAVLSRIQYFTIGAQDEPVFIRIGDVDDFSLGNGFIFNHYSDRLFYPAVNMLGFTCDLNFHYFGLDSMADNILLWDIMGVRAYIRPLVDLKNSVLSNLEIGFTMGADLNNQNQLPPASTPYIFGYNTNSQAEVVSYGADMGIFFINNSSFSLKGFADMATIQNNGSGEMAGVSGLIIETFTYSFALRFLQPGFLPSYFDMFYEATRSSEYQTLGQLSNNITGWVGSTGISLVSNVFSLNFQYEDYLSSEINPSILVSAELSRDVLKLIGIKLSVLRQNYTNVSDLFVNDVGNSSARITLDFYVSEEIKLSFDIEENYEYLPSGQNIPYIYTLVSTLIRF